MALAIHACTCSRHIQGPSWSIVPVLSPCVQYNREEHYGVLVQYVYIRRGTYCTALVLYTQDKCTYNRVLSLYITLHAWPSLHAGRVGPGQRYSTVRSLCNLPASYQPKTLVCRSADERRLRTCTVHATRRQAYAAPRAAFAALEVEWAGRAPTQYCTYISKIAQNLFVAPSAKKM